MPHPGWTTGKEGEAMRANAEKKEKARQRTERSTKNETRRRDAPSFANVENIDVRAKRRAIGRSPVSMQFATVGKQENTPAVRRKGKRKR